MSIIDKTLVIIPTYNERESIGKIIDSLTALKLKVLIIDDNSPDGTSEFVRSLNYNNVDILDREKKDGLGAAYRAGLKYALTYHPDADYFVSMDGDGSHQVADLALMLNRFEESPKASLVLGSRWMDGGGIRNWSRYRIWLSKAGTRYASWALKMPISDLTGGFRIYPRQTLEHIDFNQITSNGYCYQIEMAFAVKHLNKEIIEHPITFIEREAGVSKMSLKVVIEAIWRVTVLGLALRLKPTADKLHYVK